MKIKRIIVESEEKGPLIGGTKHSNDNSDVEVVFENGDRYIGSAFTYSNIEWLRNKNKKTGECLSGAYFWASNMFIIERIDRKLIEEVVDDLIRIDSFESVFSRIESEKTVWVFNSVRSQYSGEIFERIDEAELWIKEHRLTGVLTKYPINSGVLGWAEEHNLTNIKPEKLQQNKKDPIFVGGFTTASMEHYHYKDGIKE